MKLTDLALIFVAIFLPIVIITYVNTSFVVKAEKQEMYYKNVINSSVIDAVSSMKQVESENNAVDYGYSGIVDNKVSINPNIAISTFYNSLANNYNIKNNDTSLEKLKMYIPVVAVLDYDGIYIHSAEQVTDGYIKFTTKPKINYTYTYAIRKTSAVTATQNTYEIVEYEKLQNQNEALGGFVYQVTFTMDDYVYVDIYNIAGSTMSKVSSKQFYLADYANNSDLVYVETYYTIDENTGEQIEHTSTYILSEDAERVRKQIVEHLTGVRRETIAKIGMKEISYAINKHNEYAKQVGIKYTFRFSVESDDVWYETMDGIGIISFIQGIPLGNRYLNYKAYSASDLVAARKYYASKAITNIVNISYLARNLYHASNECDVYKHYKEITGEKVVPAFYYSRAEAATQGFYPCPICKP